MQACLAKEQQALDNYAQNDAKRQITLPEWQKNRGEALNLAFTQFIEHAGLPFVTGEDELLQAFVDKLMAADKYGLSQ